jgi:hypothetical protein
MKSWGMNLYYQHSPVNSIPFISALQTKRESSPNLQGQTANSVTALSFLYNAMIYNES